MKRYTPKVEQGLKFAIAMLEIDAEHIQNSVKAVALTLEEAAPTPKLSARDKQQIEEYRAAAEWLRDLVASYQPRQKQGNNSPIFAHSGIDSQSNVPLTDESTEEGAAEAAAARGLGESFS